MKRRETKTRRAIVQTYGTPFAWTLAKLRRVTPISLPELRAFLALIGWRVPLVLAGLVAQVVLVVMVWQLVDLTIALMEVWAELARKHLEIVLS